MRMGPLAAHLQTWSSPCPRILRQGLLSNPSAKKVHGDYHSSMAVQDLWYKTQDGKKVPSARHGRGKRWRVNHEGVPSESFDNKTLALKRDAAVTTDLDQGKYINPRAGDVSVEDYSNTWRMAQIHGLTTQKTMERIFRLHVIPYMGHLDMSKVRLSTLQSWVKALSDEQAPGSVRTIWQPVRAMFKYAVADRVIGLDPCLEVKLPALGPKIRDVPTAIQVKALLESISKPLKAAIYVAAGCGLRPGEVFGLEPKCVDFEAKTILVLQQIRKLGTDPAFLGQPKTPSSYREVKMPTVVSEALQGVVPTSLELWDRTNLRKPVERRTELFFVTPEQHKPFNSGTWPRLAPGTTMHLLRHFFATQLISKGATVTQVQRALGHSKPSVTLDTYLGYWPEDAVNIAGTMDEMLS